MHSLKCSLYPRVYHKLYKAQKGLINILLQLFDFTAEVSTQIAPRAKCGLTK